jgi:cell division protein FtsX
VTIERAQADLEAVNEGLRQTDPGRFRFGVKVSSLRDQLTGRFRQGLIILLCAVGGVLLIACTNLSNLLLARGAARRKEVAVRSAMGASRGRLIRQMLTESLILSSCGAAVGFGIAWAAVRYVSSIDAISMPLLRTVSIDAATLWFTAGVALVTGLIFGIVPALQASRTSEAEALKDSGRGMSGSKRAAWTQNALVISEVALAGVLLVGAGLLIRSFLHVLNVNVGFQPERAMTWRVSPGSQRTTAEQQSAFYDNVVQEIQRIPGVVSAGETDALP